MIPTFEAYHVSTGKTVLAYLEEYRVGIIRDRWISLEQYLEFADKIFVVEEIEPVAFGRQDRFRGKEQVAKWVMKTRKAASDAHRKLNKRSKKASCRQIDSRTTAEIAQIFFLEQCTVGASEPTTFGVIEAINQSTWLQDEAERSSVIQLVQEYINARNAELFDEDGDPLPYPPYDGHSPVNYGIAARFFN